MKIDSAWFLSKIEQSQFGSGRKLADKMGIDPSFLSRSVNGERRFNFEELESFSRLVDIPLLEVLARAGLNVRGELDVLEYYAKGGEDGGKRARAALKKS